jgi:hypothetical protein
MDISGTYGPFKIDPGAQLTYDEPNDILTLMNARLRSTAGVTYARISFWRVFIAPPAGTTSTNQASYSVRARGTFSIPSGTQGTAWVSVRGYVASQSLGPASDPPNPPACNLPEMTACAVSGPPTAFILTRQKTITLPSSRELKGRLWFKLLPNSTLTFNASKGIQVKFGPPAGGEEEDITSSRPKKKKKKDKTTTKRKQKSNR